jgi:sigma-E factor negative regulatory protein RseA
MVSMKQQLSALMDGELNRAEAEGLIVKLEEDQETRRAWSTYHLIGDVLREEHIHRPALETKILSSLAQEPTVLAPRRWDGARNLPRIALAAAASFAAVTAVAWLALQDPAPTPAANRSQIAKVEPAPQPMAPSDVSEYLRAHQEYGAGGVLPAAFSPAAGEGSR